MKYYSLNNQAPEVSFDEAVIRGIAPDKGLYFPEQIPVLPATFWEYARKSVERGNSMYDAKAFCS